MAVYENNYPLVCFTILNYNWDNTAWVYKSVRTQSPDEVAVWWIQIWIQLWTVVNTFILSSYVSFSRFSAYYYGIA